MRLYLCRYIGKETNVLNHFVVAPDNTVAFDTLMFHNQKTELSDWKVGLITKRKGKK